jgi:hypothetical protein
MKSLISRRLLAFIGVLTTMLSLCVGAPAADLPTPLPAVAPAPPIDTWTFKLTPYFWATSLSGSTTVKGRTVDVDAGFFDILEHTQFPKGLFQLAAIGEARYGRFGLLADITYMKLGLGKSLTRSAGRDALNGGVGVSAGLTIEMVIAEIVAAYEVARWEGISPGGSTSLDLYAGGRIWWQRADVQLAVSGTLNIRDLTLTRAGVLSATGNVSWVDPVIGARLRHQIAPAWSATVSGDVGGFGAGSKFSWQVLAAVEYEFSRTKTVVWNAMLGYKALSVDYSRGSGLTHYEYDNTMYGPVFGITARF